MLIAAFLLSQSGGKVNQFHIVIFNNDKNKSREYSEARS